MSPLRLSRRLALAGAVGACVPLPERPTGDGGSDAAILSGLLGLERQTMAAYRLARDADSLAERHRASLASFLEDHARHADALQRTIFGLGAAPPADRGTDAAAYGFAPGAVARERDALQLLALLEKGLAEAYLGAVPALSDRLLGRAAAGILAVESAHWALWREAIGEPPVPAAILGA